MADTREARWDAAAEAIEPWGFATERCHEDALRGLLPFAVLPAPSRCCIRAFGEVEGRSVELIEYEHASSDDAKSVELIAIVAHPWVTDTVAIGPDPSAWPVLPAALGEHLRTTGFRGAIELRPGLAIVRVGSAVFDVGGATEAIAQARAILKCFPRPAAP